jgi:membrane-associated protease RseP (regulator of RpoE activity)
MYQTTDQPKRTVPWRLIALAAGVVAVGILWGRSIMVMIAALVIIIVLHELGHFLTAKWSGMKVTEFFIGFGPRLWSTRRGETEYGIKAIPAGAYVKIIGMNSYEEVPAEDEARTYRQKSYPRRLAVAIAGSTMHFLIAVVLIFTLLVGFGTPGGSRAFETVKPTSWKVDNTVDASAAANAGIRQGDRIVSVAGVETPTFDSLGEVVRPRAGQNVDVVIDRDGQRQTFNVTLGSAVEHGQTIGRLGVYPSLAYPPNQRVNVLKAVPYTAHDVAYLTGGTVSGMVKLFSPSGIANFADQVFSGADKGSSNATGNSSPSSQTPDDQNGGRLVSIVGATQLGAHLLEGGVADFLRFLAVLNVFIGLFNLIPLLPFDGGHVAIATYERIREIGQHGRRYFVDVTRLLPVAYAVVMVLVLIGVSSVYLDVVNPIKIP